MLFGYVEQFHNKNQFIIYHDNKMTLQSYQSPICLLDDGKLTFYRDWDYSKTTRKHLYMFLEEKCGLTLPAKKKHYYLLQKLQDGSIIKGY